jgi:hypothetical protein
MAAVSVSSTSGTSKATCRTPSGAVNTTAFSVMVELPKCLNA